MSHKILVVDDDEGIVDAITLILEESGYTVDSTLQAEEIYRKIQVFKPDSILLDVLMSGQDGREICKKLKGNGITKHIPVIMISAHPTAKAGAIKSGADDFLEKPFEVDNLLHMLSKHTS
ncbi:MAG: hypothetical protein RI947_244 [Candidatus Parcubacteria bacterium]|jgi:DNA-binding response OmpR family regulator